MPFYIYVGTNENRLIGFKVNEDGNLYNDNNNKNNNNNNNSSNNDDGSNLFVIDPVDTTTTTTTTTAEASTTSMITAMVKHPVYPLIYVFTSSESASVSKSSSVSSSNSSVWTFQMTPPDGILERQQQQQQQQQSKTLTGGKHVSHVLVSPLHQDTLCICHEYDGTISFMDISNPTTTSNNILQTIPTPVLRPDTKSIEPPHCLPSICHAWYHPCNNNNKNSNSNNKLKTPKMILFTCDASAQGRIWSYAVDEQGLPIGTIQQQQHNNNNNNNSSNKTITNTQQSQSQPLVLHQHKCHVTQRNHQKPLSYFRLQQAMIMPPIPKSKNRIKRIIVHPKYKYVYILLDSHALIQVYELFNNGTRIGGDCLQEISIPTTSTSTNGGGGIINNTIHAGATEMKLSPDGSELWVSNTYTRVSLWSPRQKETILQCYTIVDRGARLELPKLSTTTNTIKNGTAIGAITLSGWVNQFHFFNHGNTLFVGVSNDSTTTSNGSASIQTFQRQQQNQQEQINEESQSTSSSPPPPLFVKTGHVSLSLDNHVPPCISCFVVVQEDMA